MRRNPSLGMSPLRRALIALVLIAIGTYFAFTKELPFTHDYQIQAVFENSNLLPPRSPVRIAGVDVGKVVEVGRYKDTQLRDGHDGDPGQRAADPTATRRSRSARGCSSRATSTSTSSRARRAPRSSTTAA